MIQQKAKHSMHVQVHCVKTMHCYLLGTLFHHLLTAKNALKYGWKPRKNQKGFNQNVRVHLRYTLEVGVFIAIFSLHISLANRQLLYD